MRYEIFDCKNETSQDYANLRLYLLDHSPEIAIHT